MNMDRAVFTFAETIILVSFALGYFLRPGCRSC